MNLVEIDSYRLLIRQYLKKKTPSSRGEIGRLALHIGVHSTFVSQVLSGVKDFNLEQGYAVTTYLDLTEIEKKYFLLLLQKDRAGSAELKRHFKQELATIRESLSTVTNRLAKHHSLSENDQSIFYSSWLYSAVRLYCSIGNGKTINEIANYFNIARSKIAPILEFLEKCNLCVRENELYKLGLANTHLPGSSPYILRHHMNWRSKGFQRLENIGPKELVISAPISLSEKDFNVVREKILECIKQSFEIVKKSEAEDVAFLNVDLQWLFPKES